MVWVTIHHDLAVTGRVIADLPALSRINHHHLVERHPIPRKPLFDYASDGMGYDFRLSFNETEFLKQNSDTNPENHDFINPRLNKDCESDLGEIEGVKKSTDCGGYQYKVVGDELEIYYSTYGYGVHKETTVDNIFINIFHFLCDKNDPASIRIKDYIKQEMSIHNVKLCTSISSSSSGLECKKVFFKLRRINLDMFICNCFGKDLARMKRVPLHLAKVYKYARGQSRFLIVPLTEKLWEKLFGGKNSTFFIVSKFC